MKKLIIVLLCLSLLSACGSNDTQDAANDTTFTVGMECAYAPFNYQVSEASDSAVAIEGGGYCDGYDVMVAQRIADSLGQELEVRMIAWNGLQVALDSGEIDAIIAGMTADEEREEGIDFTSPYYDSHGMIMIVRADSEEASYTDIQDFSGKRVVGQMNTNYDSVIDQIEGVNHQTPLATYPELVAALQNGVADGLTAEMPVAEGVVAANPGLAIVKFDEGHGFEVYTTVSIGLEEGSRDSDFFNAVQEALDSIDQDTRNEYMATAVENAPTEE